MRYPERTNSLRTQAGSAEDISHYSLSILPTRVKCAKFFGDYQACRIENKICRSFIAFVS